MTDGAGGRSRRPSPVAPDGPARSAATAAPHRKLNGVPTTETHPGAVTLLTALGNTVTVTLREPDVERVAHLLAEIIRDDEAFSDA